MKTVASNDWGREGSGNAAREIARVQIYKHVTKDRVLDISDMLSLDPKRHKIAFTLVEFDENYRATTRVRHFVDVPDFKLVCWDILCGSFAEWTDHKGSQHDDGLQARVLTLRKDPKYRQPYVVKIDNGVGEALPGGAVKMVRATESLTLLMPEWDARRMAQTVLDYIRDWEVIHFRKRQEAQTVLISLPGTSSAHGGGGAQHDGDEARSTPAVAANPAEVEDEQPAEPRPVATGRRRAAAKAA